jgi:hypothetical protein
MLLDTGVFPQSIDGVVNWWSVVQFNAYMNFKVRGWVYGRVVQFNGYLKKNKKI